MPLLEIVIGFVFFDFWPKINFHFSAPFSFLVQNVSFRSISNANELTLMRYALTLSSPVVILSIVISHDMGGLLIYYSDAGTGRAAYVPLPNPLIMVYGLLFPCRWYCVPSTCKRLIDTEVLDCHGTRKMPLSGVAPTIVFFRILYGAEG